MTNLLLQAVNLKAYSEKGLTTIFISLSPGDKGFIAHPDLPILKTLFCLSFKTPINGLVIGIKDTVKCFFASACHDAKIEDFHLHDCKHTAMMRMIQADFYQ